MNDQHEDAAPGDGAASARKPRSKWERCAVWLLICILLAVTVLQARAWFGYRQTLSSLQQILRAHEELEEAPALTLSIAREAARASLFKSNPEMSSTAGSRSSTVTCTWTGPLRRYRLDLIVESGKEDAGILVIVPEGAPAEVEELPRSDRWVRAVAVDTVIIQGLLGYPPIQTELELTTDQRSEVQSIAAQLLSEIDVEIMGKSAAEQHEIWTELEDDSRLRFHERLQTVLDDAQYDRFLGLTLQSRGAAAISWAAVTPRLRLTDEQRAAHAELLLERDTGVKGIVGPERLSYLRLYEEKLLAVLTPEQLSTWEELRGSPSDFVNAWLE